MLNMNFKESVVIQTENQQWQPSPASKVFRKPLAREDKESGHATSIVQYIAGASFPAHPHPNGEEILVLSGTFSDETGDFGPGSYLRNPPGSQHAPFSKEGCVIFVKLCQFDPSDRQTVRDNMFEALGRNDSTGVAEVFLYQFKDEKVSTLRIPAGKTLSLQDRSGGLEILVISGKLSTASGDWPAGTWIRTPHFNYDLEPATEDTIVMIKTGHLPL
ncbi:MULTISPECIES: cupin domain-containing protein [unclassified Endozoicomonas]|uniref:cupin domain-containing protein n=1 Tax=unclassified Endozoicomonas TaxID=2644528 RepID=UPI003BB5E4BE